MFISKINIYIKNLSIAYTVYFHRYCCPQGFKKYNVQLLNVKQLVFTMYKKILDFKCN